MRVPDFRICFPILLMLIGACATTPTSHIPVAESEVGFAPGLFARLDSAMEKQERTGSIAGGVLVVRKNGQLVYERPFGRLAPESRARAVTPDTLFDVASLAKPMAGVPTGILLLERQKEESHEAIREALSHQFVLTDAGYFPKIRAALEALEEPSREKALDALFDVLLQRSEEGSSGIRPGDYNYSNAAYLLLGVNALASHDDLETTIRERFWDPLGLEDTSFFPPQGRSIAATGRNRHEEWVVGRPFDPVADYFVTQLQLPPMHSGLFSTARDVALFAESLAVRQENEDLAKLSLLIYSEPLSLRRSDGSTLDMSEGGMESPRRPPFAAYEASPGRYYMQTGYTGCLMWVDVRTGTAVALLTNATATASTEEFYQLAAEVAQIVVRGTRR